MEPLCVIVWNQACLVALTPKQLYVGTYSRRLVVWTCWHIVDVFSSQRCVCWDLWEGRDVKIIIDYLLTYQWYSMIFNDSVLSPLSPQLLFIFFHLRFQGWDPDGIKNKSTRPKSFPNGKFQNLIAYIGLYCLSFQCERSFPIKDLAGSSMNDAFWARLTNLQVGSPTLHTMNTPWTPAEPSWAQPPEMCFWSRQLGFAAPALQRRMGPADSDNGEGLLLNLWCDVVVGKHGSIMSLWFTPSMTS